MPTVHTMDLPKPKNWQSFEKITKDAIALKWNSPNLQLNGRLGQKQSGVDIFGHDHIGRYCGIQCKLTTKELTEALINEEIENAEAFEPALNSLFVATTAQHDATLQKSVRVISETRSKLGKFAVGILYWDEIVSGLAINPSILSSHFPGVQIQKIENRHRLIAAAELGYFGGGLAKQFELVFSEFGWMANEDPYRIKVHTESVSQNASILLEESVGKEMRKLCEQIISMTFESKEENRFQNALILAKRLSSKVDFCSPHLSERESNIVELAAHLARIFHNCDDAPSKEVQDNVKLKCESVLPSSSMKAIKSTFTKAKKSSSGYNWAPKIYALLEHELRWRSEQ